MSHCPVQAPRASSRWCLRDRCQRCASAAPQWQASACMQGWGWYWRPALAGWRGDFCGPPKHGWAWFFDKMIVHARDAEMQRGRANNRKSGWSRRRRAAKTPVPQLPSSAHLPATAARTRRQAPGWLPHVGTAIPPRSRRSPLKPWHCCKREVCLCKCKHTTNACRSLREPWQCSRWAGPALAAWAALAWWSLNRNCRRRTPGLLRPHSAAAPARPTLPTFPLGKSSMACTGTP